MNVNVQLAIRQRQNDAGGLGALTPYLLRGLQMETFMSDKLMIVEIISANIKTRCGRYLLYPLVHVCLTRWFDVMQELQSCFYLVPEAETTSCRTFCSGTN